MVRPRQVSDEEILRAARDCFLEHGPSVSTAVIAETLGIAQPTLFKRFGSKRELMLAALSPAAVPQWARAINQGPDDRPLREQLCDICERLEAYFRANSPALSVLRASNIPFEEVMGRYDTPPPIAGIRALSAWLRRAHKRGLIGEVHFESLALVMLGAVQIRPHLTHMLGRRPMAGSRRKYLETLVDLVTDSIATNRGAGRDK